MKSAPLSRPALTSFYDESDRPGHGSIGARAVAMVLLVLMFCVAFERATAQERPSLSSTDRTRLAEAFRLGDWIGSRIWPIESCDCQKARMKGDTESSNGPPFAVLLITPEYEFLIRHPQPNSDFITVGYDELLKGDVHYRKRTMPTGFLATFPAVRNSMASTIVVGQAENTSAKTSTLWVITLLHERFHQLQDSQPKFYDDVNALNLSHGDQTGMWMLNYAFPYDRKDVQDQFSVMSRLLAEALKAPSARRASSVREYLLARQQFQEMLSPDDYKYFSFQLWKEGIARYTEYQSARLAAAKFRASKEFLTLPDYRSFADVAQATYEKILQDLLTQKLGESKREVVYSYGAAEGLLLDKINPRWRKKYFVEKFDLRKLFP